MWSECGLNLCGSSSWNSITMKYVRFILQTLKVFPTVDDLMAFVDQYQKNPDEWPSNLLAERVKYQVYFGPAINTSDPITDTVRIGMYSVYKRLLRVPRINEMFNSTKHQRILMHLIAHRLYWEEWRASSVSRSVAMKPYFQHSCDSNLASAAHDGKAIFYSIKPIKRGNQLYIRISRRFKGTKTSEITGIGHWKMWMSTMQWMALCPIKPTYRSWPMTVWHFCANAAACRWCEKINLFQNLQKVHLIKDFDHPLARAYLQKYFD